MVGRTARSYREWKPFRVNVGDEVLLRVVAVDAVDAPRLEEKDDPKAIAAFERRLYMKLKRRFEARVRSKSRLSKALK